MKTQPSSKTHFGNLPYMFFKKLTNFDFLYKQKNKRELVLILVKILILIHNKEIVDDNQGNFH